jgi:uncharacterized repeat protein (TIGR01451 family)
MKNYFKWLLLYLLFTLPTTLTFANPNGNDVIPGEIRADATFEHIGVVWWIDGDDDLDSSFFIEYRQLGETAWNRGAPGMRAYPTIYVQDGPLGLNYWGASALFLEPDTTYEIRLNLGDPDGGGDSRVITATTRTPLTPDGYGRQLFVVPGSGGGDGSPGNPFQGLQTAADAAMPGDTFHVSSGTYNPFQVLISGEPNHPLLFRGPADRSAIIDGGGTDRGVVTIGEYNQTISHVYLENLTIQNGHWGIDAQHSQDIYIHHNLIQDVDDGVTNRRGNAIEGNQVVCDNIVLGRTTWPGSGIPSERGIDLRGSGNVVCHNQVQYFGDCVSIQPFTGPSYGNDVYGNDVSYCVDDGIEVDYNQANVRVWRNRAMNSRMGVSVQPIRGGPAYIFRNEFFNLESVPIKMHNHTTGFYVVHNTGAKHGDGYGDNGAMWRNVVLRNNLFLGTRYAFEFTTQPDEGFRDFDYNAWGTTREIGPGGPYFKWNNVRYDTIADLPFGVEDHGLDGAFSHVHNAVLPANWNVAAEPGSRDLTLVTSSPEIDSGVNMDNLNTPFVFDGQPDIGAFEFGEPLPIYGPRAQTPDLNMSAKRVNDASPSFTQVITYTITLQNLGAPLTDTIQLTDTLPGGLTYVPGSLSASQGSTDESAAPTLKWTGTIQWLSPISIRYAATVSVGTIQVITNSAWIDAGTAGSFSRSATLIANGHKFTLPAIFSGN